MTEMRGTPLHLCTQQHQPLFYRGDACPYCAALQLIATLQQTLEALRAAAAAL